MLICAIEILNIIIIIISVFICRENATKILE